MTKLSLVSDTAKPEKASKQRRAPEVSPYCPKCGSNHWIWVNQGPANRIGMPIHKAHGCFDCLAKGISTIW